jgi:hypothetical protein
MHYFDQGCQGFLARKVCLWFVIFGVKEKRSRQNSGRVAVCEVSLVLEGKPGYFLKGGLANPFVRELE